MFGSLRVREPPPAVNVGIWRKAATTTMVSGSDPDQRLFVCIPLSSDPNDFSVTREVRSSGCTFGGGTDYVLGSSFAVDEYV